MVYVMQSLTLKCNFQKMVIIGNSQLPPYSYAVNYSDHATETYWRVERPQLIFANTNLDWQTENVHIIALTNG